MSIFNLLMAAGNSTQQFTLTKVTLPGSLPSAFRTIAFGNGIFVTLGQNSTYCATSSDGITWTQQAALPVSATWYSVTYGNGLFVAIAYSSRVVLTSTNGVSWTQYATGLTAANAWYSVVYASNQFVAVGSSATGNLSTSGTAFSAVTLPANGLYRSAAYGAVGGTNYVIAINSSITTNSVIYSTTNGSSWTSGIMPSATTISSIAIGNNMAVAVSTALMVANPNWTQYSLPTSIPSGVNNAVAYGGGYFCISGGSYLATSTDGINWTTTALPTGTYTSQCFLAYGNNTFVGVNGTAAFALTI